MAAQLAEALTRASDAAVLLERGDAAEACALYRKAVKLTAKAVRSDAALAEAAALMADALLAKLAAAKAPSLHAGTPGARPPAPVARALAAFCGLGLQAFVLAMALDAKYAAWRERADGLYDDGGSVDWRDRAATRVGACPRCGVAWFAGRVAGLGVHVARLGLVFLYLRVSAALLGTADGPVDIIVDCLTLVFVLELDNLMRSAERAPRSWRARASANDRARHLGAKLRAIAAATLDAGTSGRRARRRGASTHAARCVQINRWFGAPAKL
ncbi:hypothetical protein SO694_00165050 [Aureococcus anophagefferens]|uniref:Uncharacterized protein n=1 Tax=Aureococcus anophagefferens TaxID=44056 RepID=A0ABR1G5L1_AURAN